MDEFNFTAEHGFVGFANWQVRSIAETDGEPVAQVDAPIKTQVAIADPAKGSTYYPRAIVRYWASRMV